MVVKFAVNVVWYFSSICVSFVNWRIVTEFGNEQRHEEGEVHVFNEDIGNQENNDTDDTNSLGSWKDGANGGSEQVEVNLRTEKVQLPERVISPKPRMSWADMAQEELEADEEEEVSGKVGSSNGQMEGTSEVKTTRKPELSREQRERIRFTNVTRKKDYICLERVNGKFVNILDGLELHCDVFSTKEQNRIVNFVYDLQEKGKNGKLKGSIFIP